MFSSFSTSGKKSFSFNNHWNISVPPTMPSLLPEEIRLFFFGGCEMKPIIVPASIPMKLAGGARGRASPY